MKAVAICLSHQKTAVKSTAVLKYHYYLLLINRAFKPCCKLGFRQRLIEIITLYYVTAHALQIINNSLIFNALTNSSHAELFSHMKHVFKYDLSSCIVI